MKIRSLFFGSNISDSVLMRQLIPILIMLGVVPFVDPNGPTHYLAVAFCQGLVLAAYSVLLLYFIFELLAGKDFSRRHATETGKTITLWIMAGVSIAYLF